MSKKITRENIVWFVSLHFWLKMDSERISRDFWRHSDSTGTHIRRTVGRALRDARAIAAGGGPDLSRAKRPEPRVSRLSSSCSRAIREVPSLPRRATVFGPCPRQQHLLPNVDRSQTRVSLARRASDPSRVLCDARAFPRVTLSASMSHGDTGAATGDEVRPPPTACRARIFFFFFHAPGPRGIGSTGIRATRASPPFPHLPSTSPPSRAPSPTSPPFRAVCLRRSRLRGPSLDPRARDPRAQQLVHVLSLVCRHHPARPGRCPFQRDASLARAGQSRGQSVPRPRELRDASTGG